MASFKWSIAISAGAKAALKKAAICGPPQPKTDTACKAGKPILLIPLIASSTIPSVKDPPPDIISLADLSGSSWGNLISISIQPAAFPIVAL